MKEFFTGILDWIYKKKCYFCGHSSESVKMCSKCYDSLDFLPVKINRTIFNSSVYCAGVYSKNLQKLIRGLKYHGQRDLAYYLAKFMWEYWQKLGIGGDFQIVPVPIYIKRKKKRKYNHMELTADEFAVFTGYEVNTKCIERIKDTKPQYNLNKIQRLQNLKSAFSVNPDNVIKDKKILLFDDICTTGSTFEEMIREFNSAGFYDIICLTASTPFGE